MGMGRILGPGGSWGSWAAPCSCALSLSLGLLVRAFHSTQDSLSLALSILNLLSSGKAQANVQG